MANINKIRLSGTTYNIEDENAAKSVTLTQAEYDALVSGGTVDPNTFYIISDSSIAYMTSADTESAITQAVSGKQDTLVSGTNIKTINNQSILGSGNISIQAGGISSVEADYDNTVEPNGEFDILINDGSSYSQIFVVGDGLQVTENSGNKILSATGGGISSGEVQTMIDSSISGKTNQSDFSAHTANTTVHVTAQDKTNWNAKSDFSGSYNDLTDKPIIPTVPTSNTAFTNDAGYITSNDITGKTDTTAFTAHTADTTIHVTTAQTAAWNAKSDFSGSYNDLTDKPIIPTVPTSNTAFTNDAGYITSNDITGKTDTTAFTAHTADTTIHVTTAQTAAWNAKSDFSGSYNDLTNKLSAGTNVTIVDNVISAEGGGSTYTAGRGIDITNDTISFSLPISAGTGTNSIKCGETDNASGTNSFAIGANGVKANGLASFAGGSYSEAKGIFSMAFGRYNTTNNYGEVALGFFNKSNGSSSEAGNSSNNTLFSVGNGTNNTSSTRHNAFEIRQNGDIYCSDGTNDVKLQDTITATAANTTALGGLSLVKLTQAQYDALATKDSNTLYVING